MLRAFPAHGPRQGAAALAACGRRNAGGELLSGRYHRSASGYSDLVIVIAGKNAPVITPVAYAHGAFLAVNRQPERGQFSSLQVGMQEVLNRGRDAAFIALIDRPPVLPRTVKALREAFFEAGPEVWA